MSAFALILGFLLGLLLPRDIAPMRALSVWLMRNHDNRSLAAAIIATVFGALVAITLTGY